jgi:hypothetical protein
MDDISLETPVPISGAEDVTGELPPELQEVTVLAERYFGTNSHNNFALAIGRGVYLDDVVANIDGAVSSVVAGTAAKLGDKNPRYSSIPTTVSGLDARRASYQTRQGLRP